MAQSYSQTIRTEFNKGLLTEYSELNFPEDASVDELNCELFKAGNRAKRKGIKFEDNHFETTVTFPDRPLFHTVTWENAANNPALELLVVQVNDKLYFYKKGTYPLSEGWVTYANTTTPVSVNLAPYEHSTSLGAGMSKVDTVSLDGNLIVVSPQIEAIWVEWDEPDMKVAGIHRIEFKIRDYGTYGAPYNRYWAVPNASASAGRWYDTLNAGWPTTGTYDATSLPPLTHPWYSGKDSAGVFSRSEFDQISAGNSLTSVGHYIIKLFNPDRDTVSGVTGVSYYNGDPIKIPKGGFNCVAGYAGRAWYSGVDSRLYYSQILETPQQLGELYASNDPTSEYSSDILETDGGYINIVEANGIKGMHVFGSSLLVFAENGVWRVSGSDGNLFTASDFSVYKVSDAGLSARTSLVSGQNSVPFWWSYTGIHTIQVTEEGGMIEVNLSKDTIQTFWSEINGDTRASVTGVYDAVNNTVLWMYPTSGRTGYKYNNFLFLNVDLGAFFPWKVTDTGLNSPYICGTAFYNGAGLVTTTYNVVDSNGNQVVDSQGNDVVTELDAGSVRSSSIFFLTHKSNDRLTFSLFDGIDYLDWGVEDYEAYAESAYNFMGDLGRMKNSPYITAYMRETETGFVETGGQYFPVEESSLKVRAYWDFKKVCSCGAQEIYRHKLPSTFEELESFPSPTTVLATRLKIRGRGRTVRLRFEGTKGKAFNLLGWETLDARKGGY